MTTPLERVRQKVIEAVPEINEWMLKPGKWKPGRQIELADVLRAINHFGTSDDIVSGTFCITDQGEWAELYGIDSGTLPPYDGSATWNLALPLEEQSEGVLTFLEKILVGNE